jgi:hypothetical protein
LGIAGRIGAYKKLGSTVIIFLLAAIGPKALFGQPPAVSHAYLRFGMLYVMSSSERIL